MRHRVGEMVIDCIFHGKFLSFLTRNEIKIPNGILTWEMEK